MEPQQRTHVSSSWKEEGVVRKKKPNTNVCSVHHFLTKDQIDIQSTHQPNACVPISVLEKFLWILIDKLNLAFRCTTTTKEWSSYSINWIKRGSAEAKEGVVESGETETQI
jgi:hypothetical protein